ncbi:4-hydroxythreonine-4-phosphate dehydrogenase [Thalassospira profundimaris]|uniref:4-hydroxythreonine-4-phosphate dehydrogenase n=1 Tax=Thalassospira profundimaris TaxID=502049 RepID=A0A367XLN2_9PROT|nr:4-hydroxythreonine-4-phosphate dehydrogenase PdxA [Thalassospira profundimaris]RCK53701.1 4-hydroxythreonine-4-phosphate dehydrogenase [Thalassospira profundimaris]
MAHKQPKPLAMTLGDPGGIGPELALKAWQAYQNASKTSAHQGSDMLPFCLIAPARIIAQYADILAYDVPLIPVSDISQTSDHFANGLPVLEIADNGAAVIPGVAAAKTAYMVIDSIKTAVDLTRKGTASAVVTNPIQKSALYQAGFSHPGHTEFLAELAGPGTIPVMMLANSKLRVVPLTIHIALSQVQSALTTDVIVDLSRITATALSRDFGLVQPRLAIAGLNPHAGEDGAMGHEEQTIITPAITRLREEGYNVIGPLPADTMFHEEARAEYDVALCPYHDQALIPVKTLDFHGGVNVTLGLPFIRTSPDHGTALNIAGKGLARADSLMAALKIANQMAHNRFGTGTKND